MLEPDAAASRRDLLIDVGQAGDFGAYRSRRAARIAFAIAAYVDPATTTLPRSLFDRPAAQVEEGLYRALLDVLPRLLADVDGYRSLWAREDAALTRTEQLFDDGRITIEEQPELDLAVVRGPAGGEWHPMAVHTRTAPTRLLLVHGPRVEFRYRYESWVRMASRRPALRVDLTALAGDLTLEDGADGRWRFEGVEHITPRVYREGGGVDPDARGHPPAARGGAPDRRTGMESLRVMEAPERHRYARCRRPRFPVGRTGHRRRHRESAGGADVVIASIRWRRLDAPGHDSCRLLRLATGWELAGRAFFLEHALPGRLAYRVTCDPRWRTRDGRVRGTVGARRIDLRIQRSPDGVWRIESRVVRGLSGCLDLDLGFTPATNLLAIRRLDLSPGGAADAPAAWLDVRDGTLVRLPQRYARTATAYRYEAPTVGYAADLAVSAAGFVTRYPGHWASLSGSEPAS